jgi:hypothetical protein
MRPAFTNGRVTSLTRDAFDRARHAAHLTRQILDRDSSGDKRARPSRRLNHHRRDRNACDDAISPRKELRTRLDIGCLFRHDRAASLNGLAVLVNVLAEAHKVPLWLVSAARARAARGWPGVAEALKQTTVAA